MEYTTPNSIYNHHHQQVRPAGMLRRKGAESEQIPEKIRSRNKRALSGTFKLGFDSHFTRDIALFHLAI